MPAAGNWLFVGTLPKDFKCEMGYTRWQQQQVVYMAPFKSKQAMLLWTTKEHKKCSAVGGLLLIDKTVW